MSENVIDFYQQLAQDYHLIYADWNRSIQWHGTILDRLIRMYTDGPPLDLLDCSCGIGTQAIGLAGKQYTVHATDISPAAVERAAREAAAHQVTLTTGVADMRALEQQVPGTFDVVISCDNAIPHLLTDEDLAQAARSIRSKVRPGGMILLSIRDYDHLLMDKPTATMPRVFSDETGRRVVFQTWDWVDTQYTLTMFILREENQQWRTDTYSTTYRALQRADLSALLAEADFTDIRWHMPQDTGYYQPVVVARPA